MSIINNTGSRPSTPPTGITPVTTDAPARRTSRAASDTYTSYTVARPAPSASVLHAQFSQLN